jgi:transposase-like protein
MDHIAYKQWVVASEGLTSAQRKACREVLRVRDETAGVQRLVPARLAERRCCPHGASATVVKYGCSCGAPRYRCKDGRKTFNPLTGTPFDRLRDQEKLLENAAGMAGGLSVRKTAARMKIAVRKACRWRHQFLAFLNQQKPTARSGVVEADETFCPVSSQGQKTGLPRAAQQRPGKTKDGDGGDKTPVVVAVQRGTPVAFDQVLPAATAKDLTTALTLVLGADAVLSTDGNAAYWTVAKDLDVASGLFIAAYYGMGGNGTWHVQSVNRYDADLKTGMARFKGVATQYLPHYLGWRRRLDRFKDRLTPEQFLFHALRTSYP